MIHKWDQILVELKDTPPLNRNQIFDCDYRNGELLIAYWGKRTFELHSMNNDGNTILELNPPFTPHWVAIDHDYMFYLLQLLNLENLLNRLCFNIMKKS